MSDLIKYKMPFHLKEKAKKLGAYWMPNEKIWALTLSSPNHEILKAFIKPPQAFEVPFGKIYPELVPSSAWYSNLRKSIELTSWMKLQSYFAEVYDYRCAITGTTGPNHEIELHENWNFDTKTRTQSLIGFSMLAPEIHECMHPGLATMKGRLPLVIKNMVKFNSKLDPSYNKDSAVKDLDEAFETWRKLSKVPQWTLDLSFMESIPIELKFKNQDFPAV